MIRFQQRALIFFICFIGLGSTARSAEDLRQLAEVARREAATFRLVSENEFQASQNQSRDALETLIRYLDSRNERERNHWYRHLDLLRLSTQIEDTSSDPRELLRLSKPFYDNQAGLEEPAFLQLREALDRHVQFLLLADGMTVGQLHCEYGQRMQRVADLLDSANVDHVELREHVAWLTALNQAPELRARLHEAFAHPNLVVHISKRMLPAYANQVEQEFASSQWTRNCILGRPSEGVAHFTGRIFGSLVAEDPQVEVELNLTGSVSAPNNVTSVGPFRIHSRSESRVEGRKRVAWDGEQFITKPAEIVAEPVITLLGAEVVRRHWLPQVGRRIDKTLERMAIRQARESQAAALAEVTALTTQQVHEQFEAVANERLEKANREVAYYYTHPLLRVGMLPESSGRRIEDGFELRFTLRDMSRLAAPSPPPTTLVGDVNVYIHESALPSLLQRYAGGALWKDEFFARIQKETLGDNTVELRIREEEERWALILDWLQPWSTRISDAGIEFQIRASAFVIDDCRYDSPVEITSTYVPIRTPGPIFGWQRRSLQLSHQIDRQSASFLNRKFDGFFPSRMYLDGLNAPAGGPYEDLSTTWLNHVEYGDGWLRAQFSQTQFSPTQLSPIGQ